MIRRSTLLRGRLAPERWYPAGDPRVAQRFATLASGLRVRLVEAGPAGATPVVLIHGWGSSVYAYRRIVPVLADRGYRVTAFDLKGHGLSDKPLAASEYTRDSMRAHATEVLDALEIARVGLLVGHSMGGAVAAAVASHQPERVERLALLSPVGFGRVWAIRGGRLFTPELIVPALAPLFGRWTVAATLRLAFGDQARREAGDVDQYWAPSQFPDYIAALRLLVHSFDWRAMSRDELRRIVMPASLMVGSRDRIIRWQEIESLDRILPDARVRFVSGAGHVLPEERPDEVIVELLNLLAPRAQGDVSSARNTVER